MRDPLYDLVLGSRCAGCDRPGRVLCRTCRAGLPSRGVAVRPDPTPAGLVPSFAAGWYADLLRALLLAHKERGALALTRPLGDVLAGVLGTALEQVPLDGARVLLVPVPSAPASTRERGHDPVRRIVRVAADRLRRSGLDAAAVSVLRQRRRPEDQAGLSAADRFANLGGSLSVGPAAHRRVAGVRPALVVVCDDVLTTGATAREAQRALEIVGIPVAAVAVVAATQRRTGRMPLDSRGSLPL